MRRKLIDLRKPLKDIFEGSVLLGYAIDCDPKIQQMLVLLLSALSAVDAYQEYKTRKSKAAPTNQDVLKSVVPTGESIVTLLLYLAQWAKNSGKEYGRERELADLMLRVWGTCLTERSICDILFHKNYSRIPSGVAGFVVGLMPNYSTLKRVSLGVAGVYSMIQGVSPKR